MEKKERVLQEIKAQRQKLKLSQAQMAFELNVSDSAYRKIESGKCTLSVKRLLEISEILDLDLSVLFSGIDLEAIITEKVRLEHAVNDLRAEVWFLREQNINLMKALRMKEAEAYFPQAQDWQREREREREGERKRG